MKILSKSKWASIDLQIKDLREQISKLAEEAIAKDNKINDMENTIKNSTNRIEELLKSNQSLEKKRTTLESELEKEKEKVKSVKKDNKLLKSLCTKNDIDWVKVLCNKEKEKKK